MTLILKLDLDIIMMYYYAKNEVSISIHSKVIARTDRHTDINTHRDTMKPLPRMRGGGGLLCYDTPQSHCDSFDEAFLFVVSTHVPLHLLCPQQELFLSEFNNRETIASIEANNDTYCLQN